MNIFKWNQDKQAKWLAQNLRSRIEQKRNDRFNGYLHAVFSKRKQSAFNNKPIFNSTTTNFFLKEIKKLDDLKCAQHNQNTNNHSDQMIANKSRILNTTSPWLQPKQYFSWTEFFLDFFNDKTQPDLLITNQKQQTNYYNTLLKYSILLEAEFSNNPPDYSKMLEYIASIRDTHQEINSCIRGEKQIHLQVNYYFGSTILENLFLGIVHTLGSVIAFAIGCLAIIPAYCYRAPYFGKPEFLLDCVQIFIDSIILIISTVLFPLSMLYAQYTTNSCNLFKGDLARALDTLEKYCKEKKSNLVSTDEKSLNKNTDYKYRLI